MMSDSASILAKLPGLNPTSRGVMPQEIDQDLDLGDFDEREVKHVIQGELLAALGRDGSELARDRLRSLRYYFGEPLGTEAGPGRSSVVARSVLEAVEWVLPSLLRIFTASDQICVVEPRLPDQEEMAEAATDFLNFIWYQDNNGFMILHDLFKDALLEKLGWVKVWFDADVESITKSYTHITQEQYEALLEQDGDVEVLAESSYTEDIPLPSSPGPTPGSMPTGGPPMGAPGPMPNGPMGAPPMPPPMGGAMPPPNGGPPLGAPPPPPPNGAMPPPMNGPLGNGAMNGPLGMPMMPSSIPVPFYDCTIKVTKPRERVVIENCPPEEILISRRAKRGNIPFLAHRTRRTYSDLVNAGYDTECLDVVPRDNTAEMNQERVTRNLPEGADMFPFFERSGAARDIWIEESYVYLATEGDDETTSLYKVTTAGMGLVILTKDGEPDIEPVPEIPFFCICPIPMPHKLVGLSLADLTEDIQLIKSTLLRQMLDNGYLSNWPRIEVGDDVTNENTYEDLLNLQPGGVVRTRRAGGIMPMSIPYTADKTFPLVQYLDQMQEVRTGVAQHNQGINPDDLNKTATGIGLLQQAAAQRIELFARIFSIGLQQIMTQILNLVRRHQQQKRQIRITGKFITVDPSEWVEEMPVTVSVGLGTGNRDQILQHLMQVLNVQQQIVMQQGGLNGPLVYGKNVFDVLNKLCENAGFKEPFFQDPTTPANPAMMGPPQPPKPDPAAQAIQAKTQATVQASQAKAQSDIQIAQIRAQVEASLEANKSQNELQIEQIRAASNLQVERAQAQHDMAVERMKATHDMMVEQLKAEHRAQIAALEVRAKYEAGAYSNSPAERRSE